jgi:methionyl-tRNA formyltransferase
MQHCHVVILLSTMMQACSGFGQIFLKNQDFISRCILPLLLYCLQAHMNGKKQSGLRVLLYIGRFRPESQHDYGTELVERVHRSRHTIAGIVTSSNDPLAVRVRRSGIPVISLLPMLDQPLSVIRASLRNKTCRKKLAAWLSMLSSLRSDLGVIFYGSWLPPELFGLPSRGFINYHPAPLPELRGVEPDTFAVLEGRRKMWGTVHQISNGYDEGNIVCRTRELSLTRHMTPVVVWDILTKAGIDAILQALDSMHNNTAKFESQTRKPGMDASRKRAHKESVICWSSDTSDLLHRRLLAFCGQDIRIRLKADIEGKRYCVRDLEIHRGRFSGMPGQVIGRYQGKGRYFGQPVVRTKDGIAVLELGAQVCGKSKSPQEVLARLIPPRRRKQVTDISTIRRSVCSE